MTKIKRWQTWIYEKRRKKEKEELKNRRKKEKEELAVAKEISLKT